MSISDKQDDSNEAGKLLKHLTEGLHHWKKRWLFHLLHYFIASYALLCGWLGPSNEIHTHGMRDHFTPSGGG